MDKVDFPEYETPQDKPAIFAFARSTVHHGWLYHARFCKVNQMCALLWCLFGIRMFKVSQWHIQE
jgi:hypothetical protein